MTTERDERGLDEFNSSEVQGAIAPLLLAEADNGSSNKDTLSSDQLEEYVEPCLFEEMIKFQRSQSIHGNESVSLLMACIRVPGPEDTQRALSPMSAGRRVPPGFLPSSSQRPSQPASSIVSYREPLSRRAFRLRAQTSSNTGKFSQKAYLPRRNSH